jgi:uncharacterized protein (DUF433 family)
MAQAQPVLFPRIVRTPGIVGGEPTVAGTRISVRIIAQAYEQDPNIDAMLEDYPMLDREAIEQALAYYEANRAEIDRYIQENEDALS